MSLKRKTLILICATALTFASCTNKDYNCVCYGGLTGGKVTLTVNSSSKSKAENKCTAFNNPPGTADGFSGCQIE